MEGKLRSSKAQTWICRPTAAENACKYGGEALVYLLALIFRMKTCVCCKTEKSSSEFYREPRVIDGLTARCKQCTKENAGNSYGRRKKDVLERRKNQYDAQKEKDRTLRAKYGITLKDWQRMFREQGECCAICKSKSPNHGSGQFVVDHDHEFGNIRGILCGKCNVMLGQANDDHGILFDAAMYLIKTFTPESIEERKTRLRAALDATID